MTVTGQPPRKPLAVAMVARSRDELLALLDLGSRPSATAEAIPDTSPGPARPALLPFRDPLGARRRRSPLSSPVPATTIPAWGWTSSAAGRRSSTARTARTSTCASSSSRNCSGTAPRPAEIHDDHRAVIFGQVAIGCAVSDLVRSFGVTPTAVIGYSLGESAGLFSQRAWRDRDGMYTRMQESTLFTHDLAGECRAARQAWGLAEGEQVDGALGVAEAPQAAVRAALPEFPRAYLLIVNTPDECVIGGDATAVAGLVAALGCRFFPLQGVTTRALRGRPDRWPSRTTTCTSSPTDAAAGVTYYSGVKGGPYEVTRESAAESILGQALHGIDYPAVIESAYRDGVRLFLEMGPGASCSRMIGRILGDRPHLARSACHGGQDPLSTLLRLLASLIAERVPLDLSPLYDRPEIDTGPATDASTSVRVAIGGAPFQSAPAAGEPAEKGHHRLDRSRPRL